MMTDVLVAGSLHYDVIVGAERLPALDETLPGTSASYAFGGKGGNQAAAAARHGAKTSMAGRVGGDAAGNFLLEKLDAAGVDRSGVQLDPAASSGMSVAIVTAGGEYGAVIVSAANLGFDPVIADVSADTPVVVLQNEITEAANLAIARKAREAGAAIILNAAPARPIDEELFGLVAILVVNRVEAAMLAGRAVESNEDAFEAARSLGGAERDVIVTLGGDGCVLLEAGGEPIHFAAAKVIALSSHGAGDSFVGALAARLAKGVGLAEAVRYASAAAALHVSRAVKERWHIAPDDVFQLMEKARNA
jgi:ribokinase